MAGDALYGFDCGVYYAVWSHMAGDAPCVVTVTWCPALRWVRSWVACVHWVGCSSSHCPYRSLCRTSVAFINRASARTRARRSRSVGAKCVWRLKRDSRLLITRRTPAASWFRKSCGGGSCNFSIDTPNYRQRRLSMHKISILPQVFTKWRNFLQMGVFGLKFCIRVLGLQFFNKKFLDIFFDSAKYPLVGKMSACKTVRIWM